ncbi:MAG: glycosyltransferase family 39 protein [Anaerolineae bacterium]
MRSSSRRLFTLLSFACIIFIATWLRVHEAGSIPPGLHFDEATDLLRSWRVANGYGLPLYFNEAPEPFDAFYRGVLGYFVGHDRVVQRYAISFLSILSVAATMGAAQALYGKQPQRDLMILIAGLAIAVMPASIMVGRTLYRANWVAPMCMLALMWLARAWNTRQTRHYVLCAVFTALGAMFYPAGLFFPPTMALLFGLAALAERRTFPGWRRTLLMALVFIVVMSPWIYLYIRIPGWLTQRLDDLSGNGLPIIGNPAAFVEQLWLSVRLIAPAARAA